jgi:hypothetical protein
MMTFMNLFVFVVLEVKMRCDNEAVTGTSACKETKQKRPQKKEEEPQPTVSDEKQQLQSSEGLRP